MSDPFVHLRVASGYSLRYGACQPGDLVARAADLEMDTLALTDRDGLYGAIRFVRACADTGVAPVLGADLAVQYQIPGLIPPPPQRKAVRGGEVRDPRLPRVVVLATSRTGWAALCRLVSATHLGGVRGAPVSGLDQIALAPELIVTLGADSEFGLAVAEGRPDWAEESLLQWRNALPPGALTVAVTDHRLPGRGVGSIGQAARMLAVADRHRVPVVLTNRVRMIDRDQAKTIDVLDSARRLVPLDRRNVDRRNAEAYLKSGKEMLEIAEQVAVRGGRGPGGGGRLFADTRMLAMRCRLDPVADIGLGEIHLPELEMLDGRQHAHGDAQRVLIERCRAGIAGRYGEPNQRIEARLDEELQVVGALGFASYFLTVADVVDMVRRMGVRVAARGSGAGSLINFLLGISGVDPIRYGLVMERFLSPLRRSLPDIDLDVESARREEIYRAILSTFGDQRVACVAMLDTYRVRHAVRDVGAALSLPPGEIDAIAKAFPHIRARDARAALRDLPELRAAGLAERRLDLLFELVESLDGLPRHVALHPCGVLLSDATLRDRTPVEESFAGFPMSQFDKDDVEEIGLLKLDVLGIRMQSAMAHAVDEIARTTGETVDLDGLASKREEPFSDRATYDLIASTHTLGCFQIESPGQRELIGKFGPQDFTDIIIDISLFRPGPVKSDMVRPFLEARHGWTEANYLHPDLEPVLAETAGVVVFHEQVIQIIAIMTGCTLARADEARRALGRLDQQPIVKSWFCDTARERGYEEPTIARVWPVLEAFASFGFCKAHAAAFALPTYQSTWLKAHWPAHFLAGVLTHDPGMYPKRLILEEVRRMGLQVFGLDVNLSDDCYRVERGERTTETGEGWGIRLALSEVKGIGAEEVTRIIAGRPYRSLPDFWARARASEPVTERLILAGGFDSIHHITRAQAIEPRGKITRRDLLLALADLQRNDRAKVKTHPRAKGLSPSVPAGSGTAVQLPLDFDETGSDLIASGLPEMNDAERVRAELGVLGMDASRHVVDFYRPMLEALRVSWSKDLLKVRRRENLLVAGVKVATQTPPVRSGRRVVFLTLDDTTGPVDATFFEDVQGPYARTLFNSWILLVRGDLRRTGPRGVSVLATGCWDLTALFQTWTGELELTRDPQRALGAVFDELAVEPEGYAATGHRVLVHPSGYRQSAYADIKPAGSPAGQAPRKVWHSSPGSSGR